MNIPHDLYIYLTEFADDKTILNMLSVNKKFSDDRFFKRVLERRYPHLLAFKGDGETYKDLYLRMIYAIAKLEEEYNIPYFSVSGYDPYFFNRINKIDSYRTLKDVYTEAAGYAAQAGDLEQVKRMISKGGVGEYILPVAARGGHMNVIKYLLDNYEYDINRINHAMGIAGSKGFMDIVKYLVSKGANGFGILLIYSSYNNQIDAIKYAIDHGVSEDDIDTALSSTDSPKIKELIINYYNSHNKG